MSKRKIPVFIVEEHHEAFYVWHYSVINGWMPESANTLYHFDEHSDMGSLQSNTSIHQLGKDLDAIHQFMQDELSIASFIIPAAYQGLFNKIYWIKQQHRTQKSNTHHQMFVRSYNNDGKKIIYGPVADLINLNDKFASENMHKEFLYALCEEKHLAGQATNVTLDIDLDYFSCSGDPNAQEEIYIEITREEYESFVNDKYHRLRYLGPRIDVCTLNDSYFYVFNNYTDTYPSILKVSETTIDHRIDNFINTLTQNNITPDIITICRSAFSGYTASDQWEYIEKKLLNGLGEVLQLEEACHISNILPAAVIR
ncbi:UPF0489 family protein [Chitinophaga sp. 22321]|uniref:UPF0489 family protein n=1 Tax=Chitinophaga hostae TaxID=2831022 RepID=A0ABS5JAG4_9BACT|nr:UPF0489 family protein [Chitinophaga hostae]MBS0032091.1 UPF0489 family protein [Chitinophaga hostae]